MTFTCNRIFLHCSTTTFTYVQDLSTVPHAGESFLQGFEVSLNSEKQSSVFFSSESIRLPYHPDGAAQILKTWRRIASKLTSAV